MKKNQYFRYIFKGYVQGVGFRSFCHYHANKLEITGSVRNLSNGDVEVIAYAQENELSAFFERIRFGPPGSHVTEVLTEELSDAPLGKGFKIL